MVATMAAAAVAENTQGDAGAIGVKVVKALKERSPCSGGDKPRYSMLARAVGPCSIQQAVAVLS